MADMMRQLLSKRSTMETYDVITGPCTLEQARVFLTAHPYIVENRLTLGLSVWWGEVELFTPGKTTPYATWFK